MHAGLCLEMTIEIIRVHPELTATIRYLVTVPPFSYVILVFFILLEANFPLSICYYQLSFLEQKNILELLTPFSRKIKYVEKHKHTTDFVFSFKNNHINII